MKRAEGRQSHSSPCRRFVEIRFVVPTKKRNGMSGRRKETVINIGISVAKKGATQKSGKG